MRRERVFEMIAADNYISAKSIAEALGVSERTVQSDISKLKEAKRLDREGGDRGGHYIILK